MTNANPYRVEGEWLAMEAGRCTCYGPDPGHGHEPHCGYEPIEKVQLIVDALRAAGWSVWHPLVDKTAGGTE